VNSRLSLSQIQTQEADLYSYLSCLDQLNGCSHLATSLYICGTITDKVLFRSETPVTAHLHVLLTRQGLFCDLDLRKESGCLVSISLVSSQNLSILLVASVLNKPVKKERKATRKPQVRGE
jgi:hypothetical protein